ncbi:ABC transporter ATP-binding protein [Miltoncostaea oceani]|uniref:ABC transporter ATP-binding protein n=1 Tax=Miltoncostaea oceani TaxID=2843216 RepID=UPI001C3CFACF|nr:ATP-binding cassette domain-containing protein [Miltoncostaea oceani]
MLVIDGLTKSYGGRRALDDLTVEVPAGEVVGLLGPNGSGKTTAMRIVFGVIDADAGRVTYRGGPIGPVERRRFGYMPEERGLYPDMRVRDQLVYFGRLAGVPRARAAERADALLERLGIADRADEEVQKLSLGNQQRVQLAAALVHEPEALVLDEPFSGLDPLAVAGLSEIVQEAADAGRLVLFSSHQLDLVEGLCESVAVIDHGRQVMSGRVEDLKAGSGRRVLRVVVGGDEQAAWARSVDGVRVLSAGADGARLALDGGTDPLAVLDRARAAGTVTDFGLEMPSLTELFMDAVDGRR